MGLIEREPLNLEYGEKVMYICKLEDSGDHGLVTLGGALTIEAAEEMKNVLAKAMNEHRQVVVKLDALTAVSLSCLQLLCSAHKTALIGNKQLTLEGEYQEEFRSVVRAAGYLRHRGCELDFQKSCLWLEG